MATVRHYLKCDVCGSIILLRVQLGWLDQHPIRVHCGNCGILISGTLKIDQVNIDYEFDFKNAEICEERRPDFYIEASGELLVEKLKKYEGKPDIPFFPPPFFISKWEMGDEKYDLFKTRTLKFLHTCREEWPRIRRINELWFSGQYQYLVQEINKVLPVAQYPMINELDYLRGVHLLNISFLANITEELFNNKASFISNEIENLEKINTTTIAQLADYFQQNGLLERYEERIFNLIDQLVGKFQFLIPISGFQYYKEIKDEHFTEKGITTVSFEDLKQFYLDTYESAGDIIELLIAFNNLKHRSSYELMTPKRRDVQTLSDFEKKTKGIRTSYIEGQEDFDNLIYPYLDSRLRNAIGHNTYKYEGVNQVITYYPNGVENPANKNELFLISFLHNCWNLFQSIINLSELVYQTRKIFFINKGYIPSKFKILELPKHKVGRNDPCPCGSGKKYKKCCGCN